MSLRSAQRSPVERWLPFRRARPRAELRLFCFPHAGGGASAYRLWPTLLPERIDVCPVQPPGRENRLREAPFTTMESLVDAIDSTLAPLLDRPFAFFGHSLGATVAFEWAHRLRQRQQREPEIILVSARAAPVCPPRHGSMFDLPQEEFERRLAALAGTPAEILANDEMMTILTPLLRADFEIHDTYRCAERPLLSCPITVFGGRHDAAVGRDELEAWRDVTAGPVDIETLPGDHFSLLASDALLAGVSRALTSVRQ